MRFLLVFVGAFWLACSSDGSDGTSATGDDALCGCMAGDTDCCAITLSPSSPEATVSLPIVTPGDGRQKYTGVRVDATAFDTGGTLVVRGTVGGGAAVSVDLYPGSTMYPTQGTPTGQLVDCWNNGGGSAFTVGHTFTEGALFNLGATGTWDLPAGEVNTVSLTLSVTSDAAPEKSCGGGSTGGSDDCQGCSADSDCGSCERCQRSTCTCIARLSC